MEKIMTISVSESDWKYLRERKVDFLSTLCGRINEQSKDILNDQSLRNHGILTGEHLNQMSDSLRALVEHYQS